MDPLPQPDLIGQTIGNYLVTQKLGEGGMGSVYLAEHPTIGKKVALKVLHTEYSSNKEVATRFFNEAKAVNDIQHPNIVDIVDFGIIQGREQLVYFIMEYLAGETLAHLIRREAPLPPERALTIALQVADALSASHRCGIVHRDLKPDNVILVSRGREKDFVKILDFGIAKLTTEGASRTRTGLVMGTPAYMSPEQCEGRAALDQRTDIYALGIVLYEMLVGRVPFIGEAYGEILVQHLTQLPRPPSQFRILNAHVEAVVMKALEKRPDMRYPTMDEFLRAMADPVGYVEAHGGIPQFMQQQLMPSTAPLPMKLTPAPITPVPGTISQLGSQPIGMAAPSGFGPAPKRRVLGFVIAGTLVVAGAVVGVMVVLASKSKTADPGSQTMVVTPAPADAKLVDKTVVVTPTPDAAIAIDAGPLPPVKIALKSIPPGAEIFEDGKDTGKKTPATIEVARDVHKVQFELHLKGFEVRVLDPLDGDGGDQTLALDLKEEKKKPLVPPHQPPPPHHGSNTARGSNDTGLLKPGED